MLSRQFLNKFLKCNRILTAGNGAFKRNFCDGKKGDDNDGDGVKGGHNLKLGEIGSKYQVFKDEDSEVILDVYEEKLKFDIELEQDGEEAHDPFAGLNLERGVTGVFEIEDLVELLKQDNAEDIFVVAVPPDIKYVDHLCIVTGRSHRHMVALAEFAKKVYKKKRNERDPIPKIEGENSKDWIALDLGNIALHIFSKSAREHYDLETLWSVGSKYDNEFIKRDPIVELLEKHSIYLKDLQPAS